MQVVDADKSSYEKKDYNELSIHLSAWNVYMLLIVICTIITG